MIEENKLLIFQQYSEILDSIFYYQDQQVELRAMCSKIMLGTFALVGGLLFIRVEINSYQLLVLSTIFPFLALIIVTINLATDLFYKERLKIAFLSEAFRLEKTYQWLPQLNVSILENNPLSSYPASGQLTYYLGSAALLLILSLASVILFPLFSSLFSKLMIFTLFFLFYSIYHLSMKKIVKNTSQLLRLIEKYEK